MRAVSIGLIIVIVAGCAVNSGAQNRPTSSDKSKYAKRISALTPLQYRVTQKDGTERPFRNEYWDNKAPGVYVDVVSGEPLFSSTHKYKSGTGWPSFTQPLVAQNIVEVKDVSHGMTRVEVRSRDAVSHLGHLFRDGPAPTGLRYCINSAALRFVPVAKLASEGLGQFAPLFSKATPSTSTKVDAIKAPTPR